MSHNTLKRVAPLLAIALTASACHSFVLNEEKIAPELAPVTRVDVVGADTTYVLRTAQYALLSRERRLLWARATLDDAAHRFQALFGAAPRPIAVRIDSAPARAGSEWEGLPLVTVPAPSERDHVGPGEDAARAMPLLAQRATATWVRALGAPPNAWWLETGAVPLIVDVGARGAAVSRAAGAGDRTSLMALLASAPPTVAAGVSERDPRLPLPASSSVYRTTATTADARPDPLPTYRGPLVAAQASALLLFMRDRDSAFVAELPARLRAGETFPALITRSTTLPHTPDAFDAAWRTWLKARAAGRAPRAQ